MIRKYQCFTELSMLCIIFIFKELKMNLVKTDIRTLNISLLTDFFLFLDVSEKTMATYRRALKQLFVIVNLSRLYFCVFKKAGRLDMIFVFKAYR